ncbi:MULTISPECIES: hypothetical protein [Acinetobacter]|uniref:hypothetical protein n=1 Tax=Acinetobacter TaxID=469 RepID=UPI00141ACB3A|nr:MULTISPECIES: hypothetical protein [Acinetobacter]MCS4300441.1 hypothetical protein [Acinetobacter guillouiae]MCW2253781.1 hypothetical protein [Acinetobacter sp. BIGb0204]NII37824.1 hypothetical protein [Acinetobacter sp. BIGb0196]
MFKKMIITVLLLSSSSFSLAMSCFELNLQSYKKEQEIQPRWELLGKSKHRIYFYSAPKNICKMNDTFVLQNDNVTAYSIYKDRKKQDWVYVIFNDPNQNIEDDLVEGWVKLKDFKFIEKTPSVNQ